MQPNCACGGKYRTIDPIRPVEIVRGFWMYDTTRLFPGKATWKCDGCKRLQQQGLRTSKKGVKA